MTADGPMEYDLHTLNGLKWANCDVELETGSGIVPFIYSGKAPVPSVQWAIGLELFLLVNDPAKVCLTTDSPNAGPFTRYPRVISWLMSNKAREDMIENKVHKWAQKKSSIATLDREYSFYEIAQISRATPATVLGLSDTKGHLGVGADSDIAIYDFNIDTLDPSADFAAVESALQNASYVFKDGQIVVQDGNVTGPDLFGKTFWIDSVYNQELENQVVGEVEKMFKQYYSVNFENYPVQDSYLVKSAPVKGVMNGSSAQEAGK
jgi:formylmethanofuran dehydrogenase subunit A